MRSLFWTLLLILQSCLVRAIHKTDAGVVDWYRKLVGVPLTANTVTAPSFRRIEGKEVILTATTSNVLAVLDPEDGHVGELIRLGDDVAIHALHSLAIYLRGRG